MNSTSIGKTWRFWNNDDADQGDTGGSDIPHETQEDCTATAITSRRDLIDYFPVRLEIQNWINLLPKETYSYWLSYDPVHFWQSPDNMGFRSPFLKVAWNPEATVEADGITTKSGDYQKDLTKANILVGKSLDFVNPSANSGTETSIRIPDDMLQAAENGNGLVWLTSGLASTASSAPLKLKIRDSDNNVVASCALPLAISSVEDMFRHKNLRSAAGGDGGMKDRGRCSNYSDTMCNTNWLVFLHGYNVNGEQARGWHGEAFKRFFWSGSNARFVGISWYGDETQNALEVTPKYYENVENALTTSEYLANYLKGLKGGNQYIVSHSLGGLVAADAIASYGADVTKAFLLDPAIPTESLLPGTISNDTAMEPISWRPYPEDIKSSEWYRLFSGTDGRSKLTWRGRFNAAVSKLKIFYSPGEEVLTAMPLNVQADPGWANEGPQGKYAYALQAQLKGMYDNEPYDIPGVASWITHNLGSYTPASMYGGWGKAVGFQNPKYLTIDNIFRDPSWFQALLDGQDKLQFLTRLQEDPPFRVFGPGLFNTATTPSGCDGLFDKTLGLQVSNTTWKARRILAQMIPERSLPAGGAGGSGVDGQVDSLAEKFADTNAGSISTFNMEENRNGWPEERENGIKFGDGWRHGDVREVAYLYVWKTWKEVVDNANLDQRP